MRRGHPGVMHHRNRRAHHHRAEYFAPAARVLFASKMKVSHSATSEITMATAMESATRLGEYSHIAGSRIAGIPMYSIPAIPPPMKMLPLMTTGGPIFLRLAAKSATPEAKIAARNESRIVVL